MVCLMLRRWFVWNLQNIFLAFTQSSFLFLPCIPPFVFKDSYIFLWRIIIHMPARKAEINKNSRYASHRPANRKPAAWFSMIVSDESHDAWFLVKSRQGYTWWPEDVNIWCCMEPVAHCYSRITCTINIF